MAAAGNVQAGSGVFAPHRIGGLVIDILSLVVDISVKVAGNIDLAKNKRRDVRHFKLNEEFAQHSADHECLLQVHVTIEGLTRNDERQVPHSVRLLNDRIAPASFRNASIEAMDRLAAGKAKWKARNDVSLATTLMPKSQWRLEIRDGAVIGNANLTILYGEKALRRRGGSEALLYFECPFHLRLLLDVQCRRAFRSLWDYRRSLNESGTRSAHQRQPAKILVLSFGLLTKQFMSFFFQILSLNLRRSFDRHESRFAFGALWGRSRRANQTL